MIVNFIHTSRAKSVGVACFLALALLLLPDRARAVETVAPAHPDPSLHFLGRTRVETAPKSGRCEVVEHAIDWDARRTALIICDLWDQHTCDGATQRVAAMAPRVDALAKALRARGALIVHAPSDTMRFYEGTPQLALAQRAPVTPAPVEFRWNYCDPGVEPPLPIDDSDGGCDTAAPWPKGKPYPWTREHPAVEVGPEDAVSDQGREIYNLLVQRGVRNVLFCGVHANMCVLGRSFGIRQMRKLGLNVLLARDLTDTMYNPAMYPYVPHDRGTDLVVEHIEQYWCPSIRSSDVLGDATRSKVVFAIGEDEYHADRTLGDFIKSDIEGMETTPYGDLHCVTIGEGGSKTDLPGVVDALKDADVLVMFMRRRTLPDDQLKAFQAYFDSGRPVVALRTSCHAFQNWLAFDGEVLGCHYDNHYPPQGQTQVKTAASAADNPLLRGVAKEWTTPSSLYKVLPLSPTCTPLLNGRWSDKPVEPLAWTNTHRGGRVFFTALGSPDDFKNDNFRHLFRNAILWAADEPIPGGEK